MRERERQGRKGETQGKVRERDAVLEKKGKKREGKKESKKEKKEERKEKKGKGLVVGDGRRSPAAAGGGRRWPESGSSSPSPRNHGVQV